MRRRLIILSVLALLCMPLAALSTHLAAVTLPFVPAAIIAAVSCGGTAGAFVYHYAKLFGL